MPHRRRLEDRIPGLEGTDYQITSPQTTDYNCIGWALGDTGRALVVAVHELRVILACRVSSRSLEVETFITLFESQGFERCEIEGAEAGFEKIALFVEDAYFTHVARQLPSGRWTSKLGNDVDIEHELRDLTRRRSSFPLYRYGAVVGVMRRPRP